MDWEIGEIRQINDEWYQCIEGCFCRNCDLEKSDECLNSYDCLNNECRSEKRKDNRPVIFKKLEKVGEPYEHYGKLYQCYKLPMEIEIRLLPNNCNPIGKDNLVEIEIKQNKEDMEEKKSAMDFVVTPPRLTGDKPEHQLNLKSFDLQKAKEGKTVCTRDGRKVRIICFDRREDNNIVALIENEGREEVRSYYNDGKYLSFGKESSHDLMMLPEKRSGWAKVRKDINLYDTKEEADRKMIGNTDYVSAKVEWEE